MKTILTNLLLLVTINIFAQDPNLIPFEGTWTWQDGNKMFTVDVVQKLIDGEYVAEGNYKMEEIINGVTTLKYKSDRLIGDFNGTQFYDSAFHGRSHDGILSSSLIRDNVLLQEGTHSVKSGSLSMTILNTTPQTIQWKVKAIYGTKTSDVPNNFSIPTDIILTKQ
jgi:hypothetical protein